MPRLTRWMLAGALMGILFAGTVQAIPIRMDYTIADIGGGLYDYEFNLVMDNNDSSWVSGMGWSWIIVGDALNSTSPLDDFVGDPGDLPIGPFAYYNKSGGGHNGPALILDATNSLTYWVPTAVGESLTWSGTSANFLGQGELLYTTLLDINAAPGADMDVANLTGSPIPEPCTMALFGIGCAGAALLRLRRKRTA